MVEKKEKKQEEPKAKDAVKAKKVDVNVDKVENMEEKTYAIRGNIFEGKVTSAKADKTVTVERILTHYIPKYERYKKVKSKIKAHNPKSIDAKEGDTVRIGETRRISKTKNFIVMKVLTKEEKK